MADSNQIKTSVQKALASANIDSAKAERIASSLQETIAWLQSDETTATHKKAAQYAVDHPEALAPVAQGLAEGHKDFNYASGALIDRYITSLIRAGAGSKGTYKIELDRTKRDLLDRNGSGFMSALLRHASMETIPELRRELQKSGYDLSKAELLYKAHDRYPNMICNNGDSSKTPLANFKDISKALVENNDRLSVAEWKTDFRLDSSSYNFITYAARLGKLDAVFYPEYWAHHLDEMNEVWKLVPDEHRKQVDIEALRAQVTELSTPDPVLQRGLTRQQLLAPTGNGKPLLADKRVLENFPAVAALLDLQREHLSKSDLAPYMEKFIEAGQFKTVSENLAAHGDSFSKAATPPC